MMVIQGKRLYPLVVLSILLLASSAFAGQMTVFGPKDYEIQRWHLLISFDQFRVDQPGEGVVLISVNKPTRKISRGYVHLNGHLSTLGDLFGGGKNVLEKDVALKSRNQLVIFLLGSPGASIRVEVRKKGSTPKNHQPVASDQSVTTDEDTPVAIRLAASDADGDPLAYHVVDAPRWGALSGAAPEFTYVPFENFHGTDSFTFKVNDGLMDSEPASVHITVNPLNDAPIADAGMDRAAHVGDTVVLNGDQSRDVDGDPLSFQWFFVSWPGEGPPALLASNTTQPQFIPYSPGTYQVRLIVNDGNTESGSDTKITVGYAPFSLRGTRIMASDGQAGDYFGASVAVSGNYALAGAPGKGSGLVYVFAWEGSTWTEVTRLSAGKGEEGNQFGTSVSIDSNYAIVGADGDGDNAT